MVYILNIETATKNCSVALHCDGNLLQIKEVATENFSHAEKLHTFIEALLSEANVCLSALNAIAVSEGPGSYTGLRIGVSTAKGLAYSLDIPLIAVPTLEILAKILTIQKGYIVPMIDARRLEVFVAFYDENYNQIVPTKAEIIDENSYSEFQETLHLIGDGASKFKTILTDSKFVYYPELIYPSATEMGAISFEKYKQNNFVDVAYFEPFYLKDFLMIK